MLRSWLIPALLFLGIVLIITALVIPTRTLENIGSKELASVISIQGKATLEGLNQTDTIQPKKKTPINNLDVVKTSDESEVSLKLNQSQAEITILENSNILFELNSDDQLVLTIKEGDLLIDSFGQKESLFWIQKEGRLLTAIDYALTNEKNNQSLSSSLKNELIEASESLSQSKIEAILMNKKNDFFKCYGQLIQKDEQAHGQVLLSFDVQPYGKVMRVDISKTEIHQDVFLSCLKEVVLRTSFPKFKGKPVTTVFPLKFE